jgi:hypothetical protein
MGTKEDLLVGIMSHALGSWYATTEQVVREAAGPVERLCNFIRAHVICSGIFKLESTVVDTEIRSLSGDYRRQIVGLRDRYEKLFDETLREGTECGAFLISDVRVMRLALLEMCNGVSR